MPTIFHPQNQKEEEQRNDPALAAINSNFEALGQAGSPREEKPGLLKMMVPMLNVAAAMNYNKRRTASLADVSKSSQNLLDGLLSAGMPVEAANSVAMVQTSRRLRGLGFIAEADAMLAEGAAQLKASRDTEIARAKDIATTQDTVSQTRERDAELAASSETWVKFTDGRISNTKQVFIDETDMMRELRDQGWVEIGGNLAAALTFDPEDVGPQTLTVTEGVMENVIGGFSMLRLVDVMRGISHQVGFKGMLPEGALRNLAANLGITALDNEQFVDVVAARRKMRADIQSLVKGIPSNYDASIFEAMIPDPGAFKAQAFYNAQLDVVEGATRDLLALTIAFHKGTNKEFPPEVFEVARGLGIDIGSISPMSQADIDAIKRDAGKPFAEQDNIFSRHAEGVKFFVDEADLQSSAEESVMQKVEEALNGAD